MKHLRMTVVLSALALLVSCGSAYKNATPEELGESIFLILKKDDKAALQGLYPKAEQLERAWDLMKYDDARKEELRGRMESDIERVSGKFDESYDMVRNEASEAGIDWGTVQWKGVHAETRNPDGVEVALITLNLGWEDRLYQVSMKNVGHIDGKWYLANPMEWARVE